MSKLTYNEFFSELCKKLNIPDELWNRRSFAAVSIFESSQGKERWNNPLACEQDYKGASIYNTAGVRRYPSFEAGVMATATMYSEPHWANLRKVMRIAKEGDRKLVLAVYSQMYTWLKAKPNFYALYTKDELDARLAMELLPVRASDLKIKPAK